jgi:predicted DNA-binding transcriptional regulator AlpA
MSALPIVGSTDVLTIAEIVADLKVSRSTFYEMRSKHPDFPTPIHPVGPRSHPRFFRDEYEAWKRSLKRAGVEADQ